jgi:hypothetical protein
MKTCRLPKPLRLSLPALLAALWTAAAIAGPEAELVSRFPVRSITSVRQADTALEALKPVREQIENLYADEQAACYERFLVSSCLADAKDKRRKSLQAVRRIEVEAKAFLRKDKADERDRAVAERQAKAADGAKTIPFAGTARDGVDAADGTDAADAAKGSDPAGGTDAVDGRPAAR